MILTDFHKVLVADASFVFSCTKWLRRLLGTLRDLIKVHFACFRVVTDNFLSGSTAINENEVNLVQVYDLISMQNLGDARFLPQDLSVKGGSVVVSAMQIIPLLFFLKKIFRAKRCSNQRWGTQPEFYQHFGTVGWSAGYW